MKRAILEFESQLRLLGINEIDEPAKPKPTRPLSEIAAEAETDWSMRGQGVSPYARPYLTSMYFTSTMDAVYGGSTAMEIVIHFLSNAGGWRGENSQRIKKELRAMITDKRRLHLRGLTQNPEL